MRCHVVLNLLLLPPPLSGPSIHFFLFLYIYSSLFSSSSSSSLSRSLPSPLRCYFACPSGSTALMAAAEKGCLQCVKALVQGGADVGLADGNGRLARDLAINESKTYLLSVRIRNADDQGALPVTVFSGESAVTCAISPSAFFIRDATNPRFHTNSILCRPSYLQTRTSHTGATTTRLCDKVTNSTAGWLRTRGRQHAGAC